MKILLIGKSNFLHWLENVEDTLKSFEKVKVKKIATNHMGFLLDITRGVLKGISKDYAKKYAGYLVEKTIKTFNPDIIIVISPFLLNSNIIRALDVAKDSCIKIGWVGDRFSIDKVGFKSFFHVLYCTDTGIVEEARSFGFDNVKYLPLAVNDKIFHYKNTNKNEVILFVGSPTKERITFINQIKHTLHVKVVGKKWQNDFLSNAQVVQKNISIQDLSNEYNRSRFVLNVNNGKNVINGLNMRTFEAPACKACLLQENIKDLELNFDIDKEMVTFNSIDELMVKIDSVLSDKILFNKIVENAYKRINGQHLYRHRVRKILQDFC